MASATKDEVAATTTTKEIQVPEWEHAGDRTRHSVFGPGTTPWSSASHGLRGRFDTIMPPHRKYLRMSRRIFLLCLLVLLLALLALIIGLAVGLTRRSKSATQNLPLPSNTMTFTGELTYYGTGLGACGETSADTDYIVAVSHLLFDAAGSTSSNGGNSNNNPLCGRKLRASRYDARDGQQKSVDLRVVDRCTGCAPTDLDTTITVFEQLAAEELGRVDVKWAWLPT